MWLRERLTLPGILFGCGALLCLAAAGWVALRYGTNLHTGQLVVFYALPLLGAVGFIVVATRAVEAQYNVMAAVISTAVALLTVELALALFPGTRQWEGVAEALGSPDTRSKPPR